MPGTCGSFGRSPGARWARKAISTFLVELEPGRSLLDHIALIQDLEEALGCRVDVVTETALKERYKKRILKEAVPL